ncbi:MAG: hypothetical protein J1D77_08685 [Muribaculaceae bacterium]|nr:hypothetical protein [Muribaculaceae bacterium]
MKSIYSKSLAIVGVALTMASCTDNSWNDYFIDDFEGGPSYTEAVTVEYTLTKDDYNTIGSALYKIAETEEEKAAANSIRNNLYFDQSSPYPIEVALPVLLDASNSNFEIYNQGSKVQLKVAVAQGVPEELTGISAAKRMILAEAPTAANIPGLLKEKFPDATEGQYAMVSYPSVATMSLPAATQTRGTRATELTSNIKNLTEGSTLTATAVVTAQSGRGIILTDNAGSIFYYDNNIDLNTYKIGTVVNVSGTVQVYGGFQLTSSASLSVVGQESYTYPTPTAYTSAMVSAAITANTPNTAQYISIEGQLSKSGNYYNINIPGVDNGQGSLYTPTEALQGLLVDGESYTFTGYFTGITSGKYFYMVLTAVDGSTGNGSGSGSGNGNGGNGGNEGGSGNGGTTTPPADDYWTVAEALTQLSNSYDGYATVGGYITEIKELSTSYGNATYYIGDTATSTETLYIYRGYGLNGEKFTSEDEIKVGDFVVVYGSLTMYGGTTPEMTTGSQILSINGQGGSSGGSGNGGGGSTSGSINESTAVNLIYVYNGTTWSAAPDAVTVNPSAYSQMGMSVNSLSKPEIYLPLYMKQAYPYALPDTEMFVAYNITSTGCACSLLLFDGAEWTVNDNYLENKVAEFVKTANGYVFRKYIGEEVYFPFKGDRVLLNCGYILVSGNVCAGPVLPTSGYFAYMLPYDIEFNEEDGSVVIPSSEYTYTFLKEVEYNGNIIQAPEGKFVIQQSDGKFIYLGNPSYYNFGVRADNPWINDGTTISNAYLWSATKNENGLWTIACDYQYQDTGDWFHKVIYYADSYKNFANYTDEQLSTHPDAVLIELYIAEEDLQENNLDTASE